MDQENSKGQDKRNWRERLGIGAQGNVGGPLNAGQAVGKDLPKISDNYRKEPAPSAGRPVASAKPAPRPAAAASAVKPAPMAPRANPKAPAPAPSVAPDKLAERLRSQREASTKLAEQRVQVAKQRAETPPKPNAAQPPAANGAAKPKFTFAEEGAAKAAQANARPPLVPPVAAPAPPPAVQPQLSPARPPLGGTMPPVVPGFQQRPQPAQFQPQPSPGYSPAGQMPPGFPQGYGQQPVPPYRPIDPASGYAPPPGYVPQQRGFNPPPPQGGFAQPPTPRLNVPPRAQPGLNVNYQPQPDYGAAPASAAPGNFTPPPRLNRPPLRGPAAAPMQQDTGYDDEFFDDAPQPRSAARPTSTDYQQAYREAEYGYEDEAPRSKAPWILASLLLLALLVAGLGVLGYQKFWKPALTGQTATQEVPVVAPPPTPAKVQPEQPVAAAPAGGTAAPTKKQIYDRIVGDKEVLGGDVSAPSETPAAIPEPNAAAPAAPAGNGEEAAPLPIPPPPPGGAGGQQGSLDPTSEKQSAELNPSAAGESQAAVVNPEPAPPSPVADPPTPGDVAAIEKPTRSLALPPTNDGADTLADSVDPVGITAQQKPEKKKAQPAKEKAAVSKLGAKPVILVPPSKKAKAAAAKSISEPSIQPAIQTDQQANGGGLFDDAPVPQTAQTPAAPAPVKKKRTLADLFSRNTDNAPEQVASVAPVEQAAKPQQKTAAEPAPVQQSKSLAGDFVVQLASFNTKAEANAEFSRLQGKHRGTLGQFSPIISEASVGGSTRFRLSVGRMSNEAQANAVCSKLFAGGERDCLVKRR
jgi:SPOR domain